jgi:hypothetical protein
MEKRKNSHNAPRRFIKDIARGLLAVIGTIVILMFGLACVGLVMFFFAVFAVGGEDCWSITHQCSRTVIYITPSLTSEGADGAYSAP